MPFMEWSDKLSVGVPSIDAQHMKLVAVLNELFDALSHGHGAGMLGKVVDNLVAYIAIHFAYEERLMDKAAYPGVAAHKKEHADLTRRVLAIQAKARGAPDDGFALSIELLELVKHWLINHIMVSDKKFGPHLAARRIG
jgi:hemerythrin